MKSDIFPPFLKGNNGLDFIFYFFCKSKKFWYIFSEANIRGIPLKTQSLQAYPFVKYGRVEFPSFKE
jgi:hypothetical protein